MSLRTIRSFDCGVLFQQPARGGNRHDQEILEFNAALNKCVDLWIKKKCDCGGGSPTGDPTAQPAPQPRFKPLPLPYIGPVLDKVLDPLLVPCRTLWTVSVGRSRTGRPHSRHLGVLCLFPQLLYRLFHRVMIACGITRTAWPHRASKRARLTGKLVPGWPWVNSNQW
jgi:hypothetical protein